jgi:8-oxo-dGTP diphosphatase
MGSTLTGWYNRSTMATYTEPYVAPTLVVDSVIFQLVNDVLSVLLIRRNQEPFLNTWALPGGYNAAGETTTDAMARVLRTKTGIEVSGLSYVEQLFTFDTVARDPRGHAVSVTYMGLGINLEPGASTETQQPDFFPVNDLPELAYDHANIVKYAHERLRAKLTYTNAIFGLLPTTFTLTELQTAYEAVFGRAFDKRNFRKKYLSLELIEETGEVRQIGAHRPARLYHFRKSDLQSLERSFD